MRMRKNVKIVGKIAKNVRQKLDKRKFYITKALEKSILDIFQSVLTPLSQLLCSNLQQIFLQHFRPVKSIDSHLA